MTDLEYEEAKMFAKIKFIQENTCHFIRITVQCWNGKLLVYTRVPKGQEQVYTNYVFNSYLTRSSQKKLDIGNAIDAYWKEITAEEYERA